MAMCFHFYKAVPQTLLLIGAWSDAVKGVHGPLNGSIFGKCYNCNSLLLLGCSYTSLGLEKDFTNLENRFSEWSVAHGKIGLQGASN